MRFIIRKTCYLSLFIFNNYHNAFWLIFTIYIIPENGIGRKEGFAIAGLGWISAAAFGSFPFLFSGTFTNFIDAYFESISGFTTTGATVLEAIEGNPLSILFWRDQIQ